MPNNDISGDLSFSRPGFNPKIGIQFSVVGKAEHKRCNELLKELVSKAQKAQRNTNSSVKLFNRLEYEIEQFDELLDFFDVSPVALAASFLQLTLHGALVEKFARKAPTVTAKRGKGKSYVSCCIAPSITFAGTSSRILHIMSSPSLSREYVISDRPA